MTHFAAPTVIPPIPASLESPEDAATLPLSQMLRASTELIHKDVERRLGLPGSIASMADYIRCLTGFRQLYYPLETRFQRFTAWTAIGLDPPNRTLSTRLDADLKILSVELPADAPLSALPDLPDFAHALGAFYVIKGSALGLQFMLPGLHKTLGQEMAGADHFFLGRGAETGAFWKRFRAALDLYGDTHPAKMSSVVAGALATFEAIGHWMQQ